MEYSDHSPSPKLWNKIHQKISVLLWIQGSLWNVIWKMHCWVFQMFQQWRREEKKKTLKNSTVLHKNLGIQIWYGNSSKPAVLLGDLAPQIKLPHQLDSTHWCRGRGCCFSLPFHGLTSFSGVLTMANVDPFSLQKFMLLFQDNSDLDKKKHLPWWKSHPLGQTTEIQEKRGWD